MRVVIELVAYQMTNFFAGDARKGQRLTSPEYFISGMTTGLTVAFVEGPVDMVT